MNLFMRWIVDMTFRSSEMMSDVNVIVTILTKDSSNRLMLKTMMTTPWYMLIHTQMKKVFVFIYLLFLKLMYKLG